MSAGHGEQSIRVAVVQDGARGHYGLPIALQRAGLLWRIYTDYYCVPGRPSEWLATLIRSIGPGLGQRMLERKSDELCPKQVRFGYFNLLRQILGRRRHESNEAYWEWQAAVQGRWMLRHGIHQADVMMGFVRNVDPEICKRLRDANVLTIADQMIAPAAVELAEFQIQQQRFPGWHLGDPPESLQRIDKFERRTWSAVDHITCPSDYVRTGLMSLGVPGEKVTVVNYSVDAAGETIDRRDRTGPIRIGFVGSVGLRKGAPYFLEVAKRFQSSEAQFIMAGPIQLQPEVVAEHRGAVDIKGVLPRSETAELMKSLDLIYFPTTCEGSAYALLEAMAAGLPIVTSLNSGTIGRDGQEVLICKYDDLDAAEHHIRRLINDKDLRLAMGQAARKRFEQFDLDAYSRNIAALIHRLVPNRN